MGTNYKTSAVILFDIDYTLLNILNVASILNITVNLVLFFSNYHNGSWN